MKWSLVIVGLWWILFTIPSLLILKENSQRVRFEIRNRISKLLQTAKSIPKIPSLLVFMLAYMFYADAVSTVNSTSALFGKEVLKLSETTLIGTFLMIQFLGFPFTLLMAPLSQKLGAKKILMSALFFWLVIIAVAYHMNSAAEFWILGGMVALVLGISGAVPRSIYASMIPKNREGEFFSFFALSGKASSMLGPLLFGIVRDATGNPRLSILALGILFVLGILHLSLVKIPPDNQYSDS